MIKYLLKCKNKHEFESWFSDSIEYEKLKKKNLIECIFCETSAVDKSIMSPSILGKKNKVDNIMEDKEFFQFKKDLQKIKTFVKKNFDFVGDKFSREVREIYYDKKKKKIFMELLAQKKKKNWKKRGSD